MSSAKNSVSLRLHTNNRLKGNSLSSLPGTQWAPKKLTEFAVWNRTPRNRIRPVSDKRVFSKRVVLADVPPERKPERGYIRMFPKNENRNEGTFACSPGTKTGTRACSPKPPFKPPCYLPRIPLKRGWTASKIGVLCLSSFWGPLLQPFWGRPLSDPQQTVFFLRPFIWPLGFNKV